MKKPEEIKKGMEVCATLDGDCENCPYDGLQIFCAGRLRKDALAYIQQLESRLSEAGLELNPLKRQGLYGKYTVINNATGKRAEDCFVLRPFKDPVAWKTVRFYADHTDNKQLAIDLYKWTTPLPANAKEDEDA